LPDGQRDGAPRKTVALQQNAEILRGEQAISQTEICAEDSTVDATGADTVAWSNPVTMAAVTTTRDPIVLRKQARLERRQENFAGWFYALNALRHVIGKLDTEIATGMLEGLVRNYRFRTARRLYDYCITSNITLDASYSHLAEMALFDHDAELCSHILADVPDATKKSVRYQQYAAVLEQLRAEHRHPDSMDGVRHIAIGGTSFVGSTIFGIILGSLPGIAFGSETHWLFELGHTLPDGRRATIANTDTPENKWPRACRVCGRDCEVFSNDFRRELANTEAGRYAKIARRLNTSVLVTADKTFTGYWMEDPLFRLDLILLFKPLQSQIWSAIKKRVKDGGTAVGPEAEAFAQNWLDRWTRLYSTMLGYVRPTGQVLALNWDEFSRAPQAHLDRLVGQLNLPSAANLLEKAKVEHLIGGNVGVNVEAIRTTGRIELRVPEQPKLAPSIEAVIAAHTEAQQYEKILQRRYAQVLRP